MHGSSARTRKYGHERRKHLTLDQEAIEAIRYALVLGLAAYGEVVRVQGEVKFWKDMGQETPRESCHSARTGLAMR